MDADLSRWLGALRAEVGASAHTIRAYEGDLGRLSEWLDERGSGLAQARLIDLRGWLASTLATDHKTAPATTARRVAALRSFYRWMLRTGAIEASPAERLRSPRVPRAVPHFLEVDEAAQIIENPTGQDVALPRNRALLELIYGAGLRVSEAVGADVGDVDLGSGLVRVRGKGNKERIVPFGPPAAEALALLMAGQGRATPIFRNRDGGRLSTRSAWQIVRDSGASNGQPGVYPHLLRHSCATHMLTGGADLRGIQEQLGHASLATTQRYTHADAAHLLRVYRGAHPRAGRRDRD